MDFLYIVKQLNHEIGALEVQLAEKRATRDKLASLLTPQQKALAEVAAAEEKAPPKK